MRGSVSFVRGEEVVQLPLGSLVYLPIPNRSKTNRPVEKDLFVTLFV